MARASRRRSGIPREHSGRGLRSSSGNARQARCSRRQSSRAGRRIVGQPLQSLLWRARLPRPPQQLRKLWPRRRRWWQSLPRRRRTVPPRLKQVRSPLFRQHQQRGEGSLRDRNRLGGKRRAAHKLGLPILPHRCTYRPRCSGRAMSTGWGIRPRSRRRRSPPRMRIRLHDIARGLSRQQGRRAPSPGPHRSRRRLIPPRTRIGLARAAAVSSPQVAGLQSADQCDTHRVRSSRAGSQASAAAARRPRRRSRHRRGRSR